ncbi:phosphoribosyl transferase domain protein [Nemania serpens]|nr:phosphoribosyl transferase domain protein [Nemania serpens]
MATLESLKQALRHRAPREATQPLSETQYSSGFDILVRGATAYQDFVIPQLSQVLTPLFNSRTRISVLEIGPGPKSVLGYLPGHMRRKIWNYAAFEPNSLFATSLEEWLSSSNMESPLPHLEKSPEIYQVAFVPDNYAGHSPSHGTYSSSIDKGNKYDIILFCHSMYGMKPHHRYIESALRILDRQLEGGMVVVFHRHGTLDLAGLVCHQTVSFPTGVVRVANDGETIDQFASFIAGFTMQDLQTNEAVRIDWHQLCRAFGRPEEAYSEYLLFSAPEVMMAFTHHSIALAELTAHVPLVQADVIVKNRAARLHRPAAIIRPIEVQHIQYCVEWALKHGIGLTVLGGGHSGHCLWPSVVSIDMGAFDQVHILAAGENEQDGDSESGSLVVAEAGCKTGDIIRETMEAGLTLPLGARPSVGAGLWLQGGIGHLARLHGLACDAIIGAVLISVDSGRILVVGRVPSQHQPAGAMRLENEAEETDLLWAMKGAGTNFGIVVSVTFKANEARNYLIQNWSIPLGDNIYAKHLLIDFDKRIAKNLLRNCSADAYLYWEDSQLNLGVTMFESSTRRLGSEIPTPALATTSEPETDNLGSEPDSTIVNGVELFETEMYMSGMHGGHGGGKTSAFKRCLFLKEIGAAGVADILVAAVEARPTRLCYVHLLHCGGAVGDIAADATAFGCRDWRFACVITGVWPRDQDETEAARAAVQWVYNVARDLLPMSAGAYGADLGPDPRDASLAAKAFGPNAPRLARIKSKFDPNNVLAYACPLPKMLTEPRLIILVTGDSCAGKDYCAIHWASILNNTSNPKSLRARAVSISDEAKRAYAATSGADLDRLLYDRTYKEQHRSALTAFFQDQLRQRPQLREDHFMNVVCNAENVDVLFITGMREEAPVATLSHLVPASRLLDIQVEASEETRVRRGGQVDIGKDSEGSNNTRSGATPLTYRPSLIFYNDTAGKEAAGRFAEQHLFPFFHENLQRLVNMVYSVPDFPRPGIDFRHVLDISQHSGGLALCTSLLQAHFTGDWAKVGAVVCCEAGGFVFAPALSLRVNVPLALIREAGKLPPPTISTVKFPSHISASEELDSSIEKRIEIGRDAVPMGVPVVVVDDVLATGKTLCAVLQLLVKAGIDVEDITVMTLAEFPVHGGRYLLHESGFGRVNVQSLLVYGGM